MADPQPSIARNSLTRLVANGALLVFGLVSGIVTARVLGPADKGTLSALMFIGDVLIVTACSLGFGEAAIIMIGQKKATRQEIISATLPPLLVSGALGVLALLVVSIPADWEGILPAVILEGVVAALWIYVMLFSGILESREQFVATMRVMVTITAVIAVSTVVLVAFLDLGIFGAIAASAIGVASGLVEAVRAVRNMGLSLRPSWAPQVVAGALRFGVPIQSAYLLIALSQRLDQLVVYSLAGQSAGGLYAVALTVGQLTAYTAGAVSMGSFPRVANVEGSDVMELAAQVSRVALASTIVSCIVLLPTVPFLLPFAFGSAYGAAVAPTEILLIGGALWGSQQVLTRIAAARGAPGLKVWSFAVNVIVMLALDVVLVPTHGLIGAAFASVGGSVAGLSVCVYSYKRMERTQSLREFLPRRDDFAMLVEFVMVLVSASRRPPAGAKP